jgi:hypothetical protein
MAKALFLCSIWSACLFYLDTSEAIAGFLAASFKAFGFIKSSAFEFRADTWFLGDSPGMVGSPTDEDSDSDSGLGWSESLESS